MPTPVTALSVPPAVPPAVLPAAPPATSIERSGGAVPAPPEAPRCRMGGSRSSLGFAALQAGCADFAPFRAVRIASASDQPDLVHGCLRLRPGPGCRLSR